MRRTRMLRTQRRHDLLRTSTVSHRLHARNEAAFLDDQFVVDGAGNGLGHGARSKRTTKTTTPTRRLALSMNLW